MLLQVAIAIACYLSIRKVLSTEIHHLEKKIWEICSAIFSL